MLVQESSLGYHGRSKCTSIETLHWHVVTLYCSQRVGDDFEGQSVDTCPLEDGVACIRRVTSPVIRDARRDLLDGD